VSVDQHILDLLGWRQSGVPNVADGKSRGSVRIASHMYEALGVDRLSTEAPQTLGSEFERAIRAFLTQQLAEFDSGQEYVVGSSPITSFAQYVHLRLMQDLINRADPNGVLRAELGGDYIIKPDVTVGLTGPGGYPFLHAAVSCKWTIRSDRVQNIRHEGVVLTRHRRGRQPHVVTVTAEPSPKRLAAIARGTGEVDCVYHIALTQLQDAVSAVGSDSASDTLDELVLQDRLRPLEVLPEVLSLY
jgi:hypothetical protein